MQGIVLSSPLYHNRVTPTQNTPISFQLLYRIKESAFPALFLHFIFT